MIELKHELSNKNRVNGNAMIYLVCCAIHGEIPDCTKTNTMDLEDVYQLAKRHSLLAICCMALESAGVFTDCDDIVVKEWKDGKNKAIRKNLMLDAERQTICDYMEQNGIWHMPLKGVILKKYYPKIGMRQMGDNDILYDVTYQNQLQKYMEDKGYTTESVGKGNHDVYMKQPVYNFEMHTALYGKGHQPGWEVYYRDIRKRLILDTGKKYGYHFREEEFYVYIISHTYKHFDGSGTGIRSLVDIYVYLEQMEEKLNWHYISMELETLRLTEFEQQTRQLSRKLFSMQMQELTDSEQKLVVFFLSSGTYGTMKNSITKKLHKYQSDHQSISTATRRRYFLERIFPTDEWYQNYMPFAYRHKWFRPFYVVFRMLRGVVRNGKKIAREVRMVVKIRE